MDLGILCPLIAFSLRPAGASGSGTLHFVYFISSRADSTKLALTIIETRQGVPFPSIIEALIMEIAIEILREAGIRLPKPLGPAMGIVGGLIIGDLPYKPVLSVRFSLLSWP